MAVVRAYAQKAAHEKTKRWRKNPARYPILPDRMESQETQKALDDKGLERFRKIQCNSNELHQYPLGESNQSQLSAVLPDTYDNQDMPGGANSGALSDEFDPDSPSPGTFAGNSLLDAIRVLTDMPPDERAALIELLKTWG
ncbi:MAG: hypothetical protein JW888_00055 [Pirellulales bacterium]|nr:hypothetical protein [Pirellulales bacterium]